MVCAEKKILPDEDLAQRWLSQPSSSCVCMPPAQLLACAAPLWVPHSPCWHLHIQASDGTSASISECWQSQTPCPLSLIWRDLELLACTELLLMQKISLAVRNGSVTLPVSLLSVSRITFQFSASCFFSLLSLELCVRSLGHQGI